MKLFDITLKWRLYFSIMQPMRPNMFNYFTDRDVANPTDSWGQLLQDFSTEIKSSAEGQTIPRPGSFIEKALHASLLNLINLVSFIDLFSSCETVKTSVHTISSDSVEGLYIMLQLHQHFHITAGGSLL